jgi:hypothetical protein
MGLATHRWTILFRNILKNTHRYHRKTRLCSVRAGESGCLLNHWSYNCGKYQLFIDCRVLFFGVLKIISVQRKLQAFSSRRLELRLLVTGGFWSLCICTYSAVNSWVFVVTPDTEINVDMTLNSNNTQTYSVKQISCRFKAFLKDQNVINSAPACSVNY